MSAVFDIGDRIDGKFNVWKRPSEVLSWVVVRVFNTRADAETYKKFREEKEQRHLENHRKRRRGNGKALERKEDVTRSQKPAASG